ncbi:recombinase zinc beta ribbon domain-containing protein [Mycetocola sp. JXN-3]|uniref:recombinase zinc beta ribbon domain-containing protein n=1 Tax=Mycetocola sp. JXN-3 TaxID=2116510 RepID=UPI00351C71A7
MRWETPSRELILRIVQDDHLNGFLATNICILAHDPHTGKPHITQIDHLLVTNQTTLIIESKNWDGLLMPRRDAARSSRTLLGGILRCHRCGARLVAGVTRHGKRIYTCRTATKRCPGPSIAADDLDAETEAAALDTFANAPHIYVTCAQDLLARPHCPNQARCTSRELWRGKRAPCRLPLPATPTRGGTGSRRPRCRRTDPSTDSHTQCC